MAKVTIGKRGKAAAPAPEPVAPVGDDIDLGDLDLGEDIGEDLLGDLDLGELAEVDDLGVSVEDVEAAMASIAPATVSTPVAGPSISDAALAALSADVGRILKAAEGLNPVPMMEALEFQRHAIERLQTQIENLSQQLAATQTFVADSHKTLINTLSVRPAAAPAGLVVASSVPVTVGPTAPAQSPALDAYILAQFEHLASGKVYPAVKVAEVFCKRNTGDAVTVEQMLAAMHRVLADAFAKAGRDGYFAR